MVHAGAMIAEERKKLLKLGIVRAGEEAVERAREFLEIVKKSLREPLDRKRADELDARAAEIGADKNGRRILELLENEIRKMGARLEELGNAPGKLGEMRREEAEALIEYMGRGEKKAEAIAELQDDVRKSADAIAILDQRLRKVSEEGFEKLILLAEKQKVKKQDVENALGKVRDPELVAALSFVMEKQEAASIAARNALDIDRAEYERMFKISAKNEMAGLLHYYRRMLGDAKFAKARDAFLRGGMAEALAEIRKMDGAVQYMFFSIVAPALMRNGMWNRSILGTIAKILGKIGERAASANVSAEGAKARYLKRVGRFAGRLSDYKGVNLAMFSAGFLASIGE